MPSPDMAHDGLLTPNNAINFARGIKFRIQDKFSFRDNVSAVKTDIKGFVNDIINKDAYFSPVQGKLSYDDNGNPDIVYSGYGSTRRFLDNYVRVQKTDSGRQKAQFQRDQTLAMITAIHGLSDGDVMLGLVPKSQTIDDGIALMQVKRVGDSITMETKIIPKTNSGEVDTLFQRLVESGYSLKDQSSDGSLLFRVAVGKDYQAIDLKNSSIQIAGLGKNLLRVNSPSQDVLPMRLNQLPSFDMQYRQLPPTPVTTFIPFLPFAFGLNESHLNLVSFTKEETGKLTGPGVIPVKSEKPSEVKKIEATPVLIEHKTEGKLIPGFSDIPAKSDPEIAGREYLTVQERANILAIGSETAKKDKPDTTASVDLPDQKAEAIKIFATAESKFETPQTINQPEIVVESDSTPLVVTATVFQETTKQVEPNKTEVKVVISQPEVITGKSIGRVNLKEPARFEAVEMEKTEPSEELISAKIAQPEKISQLEKLEQPEQSEISVVLSSGSISISDILNQYVTEVVPVKLTALPEKDKDGVINQKETREVGEINFDNPFLFELEPLNEGISSKTNQLVNSGQSYPCLSISLKSLRRRLKRRKRNWRIKLEETLVNISLMDSRVSQQPAFIY